MEVTALGIRLWMNVLLLLCAQVQHSCSHSVDAILPHIIPSRLQFFESESVSINCKDVFKNLTKWRVIRKTQPFNNVCDIKQEITGYCNITNVLSMDSGEYWCEAAGMKSNSVNIIVTDGSVILESPVHPVMEGDDVTLSCRNKTSSSTFTAHFYKDGSLMGNSSTGKMIIRSVSRSHDGLYKCSIPGVGQSPETRLTVRDCDFYNDCPTRGLEVLRICVIVLAVVAVLVMTLIYFKKKRGVDLRYLQRRFRLIRRWLQQVEAPDPKMDELN